MQRYRLPSIASLFALVLTLKANAVGAQPADPNAAAADYRKAYAAMAKEDWPRARELLLKVWDAKKTYDVAASLGQVEFKLQHYAAAARFMSFAIANVAPSEKPEFIDRLKNGLREVRLRVGSVRVTVNEPDADLAAGDEAIGRSPLTQEIFLEPGRHTLIAKKGERTAKADVITKAGEGFEVTLNLPAQPAPLAPTSGLGVETSAPIPSGTDLKDSVNGDKSRSIVPVVIGGAVAVAAVATGIGLRISANGSYDDADELRQKNGTDGCTSGAASPADCHAQADANSSGDRKANVSTVAFAIAGGAVLATAAYWFWPRDKSPRAGSTPRLTGIIVPSGSFLSISTDF